MQEERAPEHEQVRRFYDTEYYVQSSVSGDLPWHVRMVASRLGHLQGLNALDIACGTGSWLSELARRGATVSGLDISTRAIELARARLPHADLREGVAESLPYDDSKFDLVTCMGSLEHFIEQSRALAEMKRVGKKSARYLILVPSAGFLTRRLGLYKGTAQVAIRETVRPLAQWNALFEEAGLAVTDRWRDLHTLDSRWITTGPRWYWPLRAAQAAALALWPIGWQYQVYFYCRQA